MYFAHEWIHAMMTFRALKENKKDEAINRVTDREVIALFYSLHDRCFWQDSDELMVKLHKALRYLLVSDESIREMLSKDFQTNLPELKEQLTDNSESAFKIINDLILAFTAKWSVNRALMVDRLAEVLF
jgi:hypothetical protein